MSKARLSVEIQKEILRLKALGNSKLKVSKILGINRETVRKYWDESVQDDCSDIPKWVEEINWEEVNHDINSKVPKKILYEELSDTIELPSYQAFCKYTKNNIKEDTNKSIIQII